MTLKPTLDDYDLMYRCSFASLERVSVKQNNVWIRFGFGLDIFFIEML